MIKISFWKWLRQIPKNIREGFLKNSSIFVTLIILVNGVFLAIMSINIMWYSWRGLLLIPPSLLLFLYGFWRLFNKNENIVRES